MTVERASEIVKLQVIPQLRYELFAHFLDVFSFNTQGQQEQFAVLCGFAVARNAVEIEG